MFRWAAGSGTAWSDSVSNRRPRLPRLSSTVGVAAAVLGLGVFDARTAFACSGFAPAPALRGYPGEGAEGVPTDVVPFFSTEGVELRGATFTLTSAAGDEIAARVASAQLAIVDVTFEDALQPDTTYTLVAKLSRPAGPYFVETLSLSFTTGAGAVSDAPAPPQASLQSYRFGQRLASNCSPEAEGTCVALTSALPVEATETDAAGHGAGLVRLHGEPWFGYLTAGTSGCLKLRTRAPNASYSSPVVLCADSAPPIIICGSERIACTSQGLTHDGALLAPSAGGSMGCPDEADEAITTSAAGQPDSSAGAAQAGAPSSPLAASGGCHVASLGKRSTNSAPGALLALALLSVFWRTRRAHCVGLKNQPMAAPHTPKPERGRS